MIERLRRALSFLWRWSLLITVPVGCLFLLWVSRTAEKYADLGVRFQTLNDYTSLLRIGRFEAERLERDLLLAVRPRELDRAPLLRSVEMFIPEASERRLHEALPHSGRDYEPASLVYPDGSLHEVKLRLRGDHFWHWAARKTSLRIKTRRSQLFERTRTFNFSVPKTPDQVSELLSYDLARELGLVAPRADLVDLYVNGRYRGVHFYFEQLEEMVLRTHGKMPGDIYAADIVKRNAYEGVPARVFENAGLWEKVAINNHFPEQEDGNLRRLLELVSAPSSAERTRKLRSLVDVEAFARFSAFRTLCQTFHFDDTHNQRIYYDPWRNEFSPVVWDPVGWHPHSVPREGQEARPDVVTSALDFAFYEDPIFLVERGRVLDDWFTSGASERFLEHVDATIARVDPSLDRDPGLCYTFDLLTPAEVRAAQRELRTQIASIFEDLRGSLEQDAKLEYAASREMPGSVRLRVGGRRPFDGLRFTFEGPVTRPLVAHLSYVTGEGVQRVDVTDRLEQRDTEAVVRVPLIGQLVATKADGKAVRTRFATRTGPATFDLTLTGADLGDNRVLQLHGLREGHPPMAARAVDSIEPLPFWSAFEAVEAAPRRTPQSWSGELVIEGTRTISEDVILTPGTTLRMEPAASLIFEGRVIARGTAERPVRVVPRDDGQAPWGTFAIRGPRAGGSQLVGCEMSGGSGLKTVAAEYSAMLSIHDVANVLVQDCLFSDSHVVDDMVHVVYSTIRFERCTFLRSLLDALDLDISEALVADCQFVRSGNDALDLMTSTVAIVDTTLLESVDKGVSVGEDSRAMLLRCLVNECEIGVQIKDRSEASIVNCELRANRAGIDAYRKNWRYDSGGTAYVYDSSIEDNGVQLGADKHSRIKLHDCFISPRVEASKRIFIDDTSDDRERLRARVRSAYRFPGERAASPAYFAHYWAEAASDVRGPVTAK